MVDLLISLWLRWRIWSRSPRRRQCRRKDGRPSRWISGPLAGPSPRSLVYSGGGVVVVGVAPYDAFSGGYGQLFLSTDLVHWKKITPPQSHATYNGTWPLFQ